MTAEYLNSEDYIITQERLFLIGGLVRRLKIRAFINSIEKAHAIGPILDPTLYRGGLVSRRLLRSGARSGFGAFRDAGDGDPADAS